MYIVHCSYNKHRRQVSCIIVIYSVLSHSPTHPPSKWYLSETTRASFDHSVGVCLSHMSRLTSIDLPLEVTAGPGALRKLINSLDTLPPTVLLSLEVCGGGGCMYM